MNRVSSFFRDDGTPLVSSSSKCLIHTAPVGKSQLASRSKVIVRFVSGSENQRVLIAWSDQNGTLIVYGTTPDCGVNIATFANAPVSASVGGIGGAFGFALVEAMIRFTRELR